LRSECLYNLATEIDRLDKISICGEVETTGFRELNYGSASLHLKSHGESVMSIILNRFHGNSLFFLDEPEVALSASKQMSLIVKICELVHNNSQFIIATHSPILLSCPYSEIIEFSNDSAKKVCYSETEAYSLTKYFLNNTDRMLNQLLSKEDL